MNFEAPLTSLVWLTSIVSVVHDLRRLVPAHPRTSATARSGGSSRPSSPAARSPARSSPRWSRSSPRPSPRHVREVVTASREGGASLNILSGLTAGNFSAYWMGLVIVALMGIAYARLALRARRALHQGRRADAGAGLRLRPRGLRLPRHGPGDDRRRLLRPGHRQRAVGLRALADRERSRTSRHEIKKDFGFDARTSRRPSTSSRRTTAPATPSRRPPSRCSSAPPSSAPPR